jgi:glutathione S-transferase
MLLYNNDSSGNCYKVRLLLALLGIEYESRDLDVTDHSERPEVLGDLNPALRVPTLILDDGRPLAESNAILFYLADGTEYLPEERYERAQVLQWLFFEQFSHEPYLASARFWARFDIDVPEGRRQSRLQSGAKALAAMESQLNGRRFLVGERYTIADIALYAYTHVAEEGGFDLEPYPAIRAWLDNVATQSGHVPITA